jgi:hypothetical protein
LIGVAGLIVGAAWQSVSQNRLIVVGPTHVVDRISNAEFEYPQSEESATVARLNAGNEFVVVTRLRSGPRQEDLRILIHRSVAGIGEMQEWADAFGKLGPDNLYVSPDRMGPILRAKYEDAVRRLPPEMQGSHLASGGGIDVWSGVKANVTVGGEPRTTMVSFGAKAKGISSRIRDSEANPNPYELPEKEAGVEERSKQGPNRSQLTIRMGARGLIPSLHASSVSEVANALEETVRSASTDYFASFDQLASRLASADPKLQEFLNESRSSMEELPSNMRHELRTLLGYPEGGIRITRLQPAALFVIGGQVGPNTFSHFILPMPGG